MEQLTLPAMPQVSTYQCLGGLGVKRGLALPIFGSMEKSVLRLAPALVARENCNKVLQVIFCDRKPIVGKLKSCSLICTVYIILTQIYANHLEMLFILRLWKRAQFCPECNVCFGREKDPKLRGNYYYCWVCSRQHHAACVGAERFICTACQVSQQQQQPVYFTFFHIPYHIFPKAQVASDKNAHKL